MFSTSSPTYPGLGQRRGIGKREGHVENFRQRLRQQGLAGSRRADQQDIRFLQLDFARRGGRRRPALPHENALVVVINRDGEFFLGLALADYVLIEPFFELLRLRQMEYRRVGFFRAVFFENRVANRNALIANVGFRIVAGRRDQLPDDLLVLMAERASEHLIHAASFHPATLRELIAFISLPSDSPRPQRESVRKKPPAAFCPSYQSRPCADT